MNGKQSHFYAGSTLAIGLVNLTRGLLVVANVGDSHVMLGELYDPASGLGTVVKMSTDLWEALLQFS